MHWGIQNAHWGMGHAFWLAPSLFWLIFMALLAWGLIHWLNNRQKHMPSYYPGTPHSDMPGPIQPTQLSALEILSQRYARGEIDTATFEQMRERLQGSDKPKY